MHVQTYGYAYTDTHEDMRKCRNTGGMKPESEIATALDIFVIPASNSCWTTFKVAKVVGSGKVCWTRLRPNTFSDTGISLNNAALLTVPNQAAFGETYL